MEYEINLEKYNELKNYFNKNSEKGLEKEIFSGIKILKDESSKNKYEFIIPKSPLNDKDRRIYVLFNDLEKKLHIGAEDTYEVNIILDHLSDYLSDKKR